MLEVDGKQLAQSGAIYQYLGHKFGLLTNYLNYDYFQCPGLAGKNEWEAAKAAEIVDFHKDMGHAFHPYIAVKLGYEQGDLV